MRNVGDGHTHVIFMDKNHPPNNISRVSKDIEVLAKNAGRNTYVRALYLVPEGPKNKNAYLYDYPEYSEKYVAQVFGWAQTRTDHETLDNSNPANVLEVQTMFLRLNKKAVFNKAFVDKSGIAGLLRVPLGRDDIELPDSLLQAVGEVVNDFAGIGSEANSERNQKLLSELEKAKGSLQQYTDQDVMV